MKKFKIFSVIATFIVCYIWWLIFTMNFGVQELIIGAIISLVVAIFSARFLIAEKPLYLFKPKRFFSLMNFCLRVMPREILRANVKMAKLAFSPKISLRSGIVKVPTLLKSDYGLALLANSISLRPGTITVDIMEENNKDYLYIHCINTKATRGKEAGDEIKGSLEKQVRRIFI